jgi:hypothetical protein
VLSVSNIKLNARKARFDEVSLLPFKPSQLRELLTWNSMMVKPSAFVDFFETYGIVNALYGSEKDLVSEVIEKKNLKEMTDVSDVFGYYNNKELTWFSAEGMHTFIPNEEGKKIEKIFPKQLWVVPEDLIAKYPGIQTLVGICLAITKIEKGRLVPFIADKLYQQSGFHGLSATSLASFAHIVCESLKDHISALGTVSNGREFIADLFGAISRLSKAQYVVMQWYLATGPLKTCFQWGYFANKASKLITVPKKDTKDVLWAILGVKKQYEKCFGNLSTTPTGKDFLEKMDYPVGMVPVFLGNMPRKLKKPIITKPYEALAFLQTCRDQRQSDEKGLSAYSSGVGACGNPNKMQLRFNRQLSVFLGCLLEQKDGERLVVEVKSTNDMTMLLHQYEEWSKKRPILENKKFVFYVTSNVGLTTKFANRLVNNSELRRGDTKLVLDSVPITVKSEKNWDEVDAAAELRLDEVFGKLVNPELAVELDVHVIALTHVFSDKFLKHTVIKPGQKPAVRGGYLYSLGSCHNMMGFISTKQQMTFAESDGSEPWHLAPKTIAPLTYAAFLERSVDHNILRSFHPFIGRYHFTATLNLLRHLPRKIVDFTTGNIEDNGIVLDPDSVFADESGTTSEENEEDYEDGDDVGDEETDHDQNDDETTNQSEDPGASESAEPAEEEKPEKLEKKVKPKKKKASAQGKGDDHGNVEDIADDNF